VGWWWEYFFNFKFNQFYLFQSTERHIRVVVMGKTGSGKSTMCNAFLGEHENPPRFPIGRGLSWTTDEFASETAHDCGNNVRWHVCYFYFIYLFYLYCIVNMGMYKFPKYLALTFPKAFIHIFQKNHDQFTPTAV
jgi:energy-coupling factor transporter ATP-binding protein EcfA2